jgi:hypothetical protein
MEIQSRGWLDTIDTFIPLKKQENREERGRQVAAQSNTVVG